MRTPKDCILELRAKGISRDRLAEAIDMAPEYLSGITTGKRRCRKIVHFALHMLATNRTARKVMGL